MTDLLPGPSHAVVIRLVVRLDDAEPPIFRVLEVRGELTLDVLHEVLQVAMGWTSSHLHRFWRGAGPFRPDDPALLTEADLAEGQEGVPEASVRADQLLRDPGDTLGYLYDFGDQWGHTLTVEQVRPATGTEPVAVCLTGSGACPPEDVGGVHLYNDLVAALSAAHPDTEQTEILDQYRDWLPDEFDPARFDAAATTAALTRAAGRAAAVADLLATPVVALQDIADRLTGADLDLLVELWHEAVTAAQPAPEDLTTALRPWQVLLEAAGTEGLPLTTTGRLKPAVVAELAHALGLDRWWHGKLNREDQTAPLATLREAAQALRLVRRHQGHLVRSPAGRRTASDPEALWQHLASALPLGREDFAQEAGAVWLLCLAAGRPDPPGAAAEILTAAGWRVGSGGPLVPDVVRDGARATRAVLSVVEGAFRSAAPQDRDAAQPVVRALAARALRGG